MKQFMLKNKAAIAGVMALVAFGIFSLSFQDTPYVKAIMDNQEQPQDTTKKKKNSMTMKEFDQLSETLDKQVLEQLKQVDMLKVQQDIEKSLKELNVDRIIESVEQSLKTANIEKALEEVKAQMREMDLDDLNGEVGTALAQAKKELKKASEEVKKINTAQLRQELEKAKLDKRTDLGGDIMIHGKSATIGCIPVGDKNIEEIFILATKAKNKNFPIIIAPHDFRTNKTFPEIVGISWDNELYKKISDELNNFKN